MEAATSSAQTLPEHENSTCLHEKCAHSVHALPDDLALVVDAWSHLPDVVRAGIMAMVAAARQD